MTLGRAVKWLWNAAEGRGWTWVCPNVSVSSIRPLVTEVKRPSGNREARLCWPPGVSLWIGPLTPIRLMFLFCSHNEDRSHVSAAGRD